MADPHALPNIGLTGGFEPHAEDWGGPMNDNLVKLSSLTQGRALDKVAALPASPADGDVYLLDETATGGNANKLAVRDAGAWIYFTPLSGWLIFNVAEDYYEKFSGTVWAELETGGEEFPEAPVDGKTYGRKDAAWAEIVSGGGGGLPAGGSAGNLVQNTAPATGAWFNPVEEGFHSGGGGPPYGTHRYWRVLPVTVVSGNTAGIGEMEFRSAPAGADLTGVGVGAAIYSPGSANPTGAFANNGTVNPWNCGGVSTGAAWTGWDFGTSEVSVIQILLTQGGSLDMEPNTRPTSAKVQWSDDGAEWFDAWSFTTTGAAGAFTLTSSVLATAPASGFLAPDGGDNGQVLTKASSADGVFKWADPASGGAGTARTLAAAYLDCTGALPVVVNGINCGAVTKLGTGRYRIDFTTPLTTPLNRIGFNASGKWLAAGTDYNTQVVDVDRAGGITTTSVTIAVRSGISANDILDPNGWITFELYDVTKQSGGGNPGEFKGATAKRTAAFNVPTLANTVVPFDGEEYDVGGFYDAAQPSRLTVPVGVSFVRLVAQVNGANLAGQLFATINKSGAAWALAPIADTESAGGDSVNLASGPVAVVAGDYFELIAYVDGARTVTAWMTIEAAATTAGQGLTVPKTTNFGITVNAPTVTDGDGALILKGASASPLIRGLMNAPPTGDFTVTMKYKSRRAVNFNGVGILFRNAAGAFTVVGIVHNAGNVLTLDNYSSQSVFAASAATYAMSYADDNPGWLRATFNATTNTITMYWSYDGKNWETVGSTTYLGAINAVGLGFAMNSSTAALLNVEHFLIT